MSLTPETIRQLRGQQPDLRERDFARQNGTSEGELVAAYVGQGTRRLRVDMAALLTGLGGVGEVLALTRNESAVHEKSGIYENASAGDHTAIVLGDDIDLRIFPGRWAHGFAVEKSDKEGVSKRSLQFFDAAGEAIHKVHRRPATDLVAWEALVQSLLSDDQTPGIATRPVAASEVAGAAAPVSELRREWEAMTDTHQFFGMLKRLNYRRLDALRGVGEDYAWPLAGEAVSSVLNGAAGIGLPIMVFIGNPGCTQIHSGPIKKVASMGPWINIMDEGFHMHLRLDHVAEAWTVRKPTKDGHVTSVEVYDRAGGLIVQVFGQRKEGVDERAEWRMLAESLPRFSSAA